MDDGDLLRATARTDTTACPECGGAGTVTTERLGSLSERSRADRLEDALREIADISPTKDASFVRREAQEIARAALLASVEENRGMPHGDLNAARPVDLPTAPARGPAPDA